MSSDYVSRESERTVVLAAYVLHLVGGIIGITSLIGLILNYVRLDRYGYDIANSHHRWMIRSFWWALLWGLIGWFLVFVLIGWPILFLTWLWYVYRHVRGLIALVNGEPMPR